MAPYKIKRPAQNAWRVRGGFFQVCRLLGVWWPARMAGLIGSAIDMRKKTAFSGGYFFQGAESHSRFAPYLMFVLFGLSE